MKKVILRKDIGKAGRMGDIVSFKDGYVRNYLLPQGLAWEATAENLKKIEAQKKQKEVTQSKEKGRLQKLAAEISGISCTVSTEAQDDEQLYGSITAADIAAALEAEKNIVIDKKDIVLEQPIKSLGIYEAEVRLHPEITTKIRVWVTRK